MRTKLDALITRQCLNHLDDSPMVDAAIDDDAVELRQLCCKVTPQLWERLESVCNTIDVRKRAFITAALIDAIEQAREIMEEEGVFDAQEGLAE